MDQVRGNRHKQQPTIDGNSNMGGGWQRYHLMTAVSDLQQKLPAMRETTAAMDNGGCWCLTVVMDGMMKIAYDGVGNGQWQSGGQRMVQCQRWVATVQWWMAMVVAMVNHNGSSIGQWRGGYTKVVARGHSKW